MNTTRILTQAQAEAIYSAMCALNNVGALLSTFIRTDSGKFIEVHDNGDEITLSATEIELPSKETHASQSAFAAAYGLTHAADQREAVQVVTDFAERARKQYENTKEITSHTDGTCMTIRVPVALLNRIRDMGDEFGIGRSDEPQSAVAAAAGGLTQTAIER